MAGHELQKTENYVSRYAKTSPARSKVLCSWVTVLTPLFASPLESVPSVREGVFVPSLGCRNWVTATARHDLVVERHPGVPYEDSSGGNGMLEMTNENFARLLKGLTIAVGNRKNRILLPVSCGGDQGVALLVWSRGS